MKNWVRNLITRVIAIAPSLIVSVVSGPSGAGKLIIFSSVSNSISWVGLDGDPSLEVQELAAICFCSVLL